MEPIKLRYSEPFIRSAIRVYWWKQIGPSFLLLLISLTVFLVYRIAEGDSSWIVGAIGTVLVLGYGIIVASYVVHLRRSLKRFRRMKVPEATLELGEERFKVTSDVGSSEVEWSLIAKIWRFKNVWLLFFSESEFMTLPVDDLSSKSKLFILAKAEANGAKIA